MRVPYSLDFLMSFKLMDCQVKNHCCVWFAWNVCIPSTRNDSHSLNWCPSFSENYKTWNILAQNILKCSYISSFLKKLFYWSNNIYKWTCSDTMEHDKEQQNHLGKKACIFLLKRWLCTKQKQIYLLKYHCINQLLLHKGTYL